MDKTEFSLPDEFVRCNDCKTEWFEDEAAKCPNCGSTNLTIEFIERF